MTPEQRAAKASKEICEAMYSGGNSAITTPIITAAIRAALEEAAQLCGQYAEEHKAKLEFYEADIWLTAAVTIAPAPTPGERP